MFCFYVTSCLWIVQNIVVNLHQPVEQENNVATQRLDYRLIRPWLHVAMQLSGSQPPMRPGLNPGLAKKCKSNSGFVFPAFEIKLSCFLFWIIEDLWLFIWKHSESLHVLVEGWPATCFLLTCFLPYPEQLFITSKCWVFLFTYCIQGCT